MTKKFNVVYFGTPEFSVPTLELLAQHPLINLKFVISMPDRPAGRGNQLHTPEVIQFAKAKNIPFFQTSNINKEDAFLEQLSSMNIDLFIVLAFSQFLSTRLLTLPKLGCYNIHTSVLPKYRGAAPIQYALLNGDDKTGVSIQKMVKQLDAGDITTFVECDIHPDDTYKTLAIKLSNLAPTCLSQFIEGLSLQKITFTKQDEKNVSFAPTIKKEEGLICFNEQTAQEIYNRFRAYDPWPGVYTFINKKRVKLINLNLANDHHIKPGSSLCSNDSIIVGCKSGSISLNTIQLEGKKQSSGKDLFNGLRGELQFSKDSQ